MEFSDQISAELIIYLYYNVMRTTAAVFSIHSAPPNCSTVCYLTLYTHIESKALTWTLSMQVECDKSVPVPN